MRLRERCAECLGDVLRDDDAGRVRRQLVSTSLIASVPPVEAPIAMTRSVVRNGRARGGAFGSTASALWAGPTAPGARGCLGSSARTLAQAAIRIFSMSSSA